MCWWCLAWNHGQQHLDGCAKLTKSPLQLSQARSSSSILQVIHRLFRYWQVRKVHAVSSNQPYNCHVAFEFQWDMPDRTRLRIVLCDQPGHRCVLLYDRGCDLQNTLIMSSPVLSQMTCSSNWNVADLFTTKTFVAKHRKHHF